MASSIISNFLAAKQSDHLNLRGSEKPIKRTIRTVGTTATSVTNSSGTLDKIPSCGFRTPTSLGGSLSSLSSTSSGISNKINPARLLSSALSINIDKYDNTIKSIKNWQDPAQKEKILNELDKKLCVLKNKRIKTNFDKSNIDIIQSAYKFLNKKSDIDETKNNHFHPNVEPCKDGKPFSEEISSHTDFLY